MSFDAAGPVCFRIGFQYYELALCYNEYLSSYFNLSIPVSLFFRNVIYQLWVSPLNYRLFIGVQLSDRNWFVLLANSLLV